MLRELLKIPETHGTEPKKPEKPVPEPEPDVIRKNRFFCRLFIFRPEPEPKFSQVPIGYKFSRPERPGPERNRPEPDPKIRMPRPMCT